MMRVLGNRGASVVSVAAMISIFAALNGSILSGSRVPYAMARDGLFFHKMPISTRRSALRERASCCWAWSPPSFF